MVIDVNKQDVCEEMVHDFSTAQFHERINQNTAKRKSIAVQEAKSRAVAVKKAERSMRIRNAKKWRSARSLAGAAATIGVLAYAYTTWQISVPLFIGCGFIASVYFGWCLNSTVRLFRRKHRGI